MSSARGAFVDPLSGLLRKRKARRLLAGGTSVVLFLALLITGLPILNPPTALSATTTLSILSGQAEVMPLGATSWQPGIDGTTLKAGDRVRTLQDGRALITFFEGSTSELEPNTDLTIQALETARDSPATTILLKQWMGSTWHRVVQLVDPASSYEIETPVAVATVRGTLLMVGVQDNGNTSVQAIAGSVQVQAQQTEVTLEGGRETEVAAGEPPRPPTVIRSSPSRLTLSLHSPVWMRVVDPLGRSVGVVPPGIEVSQIPGAKTTAANVEPQGIVIDNAVPGEYSLVLYARGPGGSFELRADGLSSDNLVFQRSAQDKIGRNEQLISTLRVRVEDGAIVGGDLATPARPKSVIPGKVVLNSSEAMRIIAAATATARPAASGTYGMVSSQETSGDRTSSAPRPSYDPLPFEKTGRVMAALLPQVVGAARGDLALLEVRLVADRGGFRAQTTVARPRETPIVGAPARSLASGARDTMLSRLVPRFDQEPLAFGVPPAIVIGIAPSTPAANPTPGGSGPDSSGAAGPPAPSPSAVPAANSPTPPAGASPTAGPSGPVATTTPTVAGDTPAPARTPATPTPATSPTPTIVPATPSPTQQPTLAPSPTAEPPATPTPSAPLMLTSDRVGQPIVQAQNMRPGGSASGAVTLGNAGSLPFAYSLRVQGGTGPLFADPERGLQLQVMRIGDNMVLYEGPLAADTGPLGRLMAGEKVVLVLRVSLPATAGDAMQGSTVTVDFVWTAVEPP